MSSPSSLGETLGESFALSASPESSPDSPDSPNSSLGCSPESPELSLTSSLAAWPMEAWESLGEDNPYLPEASSHREAEEAEEEEAAEDEEEEEEIPLSLASVSPIREERGNWFDHLRAAESSQPPASPPPDLDQPSTQHLEELDQPEACSPDPGLLKATEPSSVAKEPVAGSIKLRLRRRKLSAASPAAPVPRVSRVRGTRRKKSQASEPGTAPMKGGTAKALLSAPTDASAFTLVDISAVSRRKPSPIRAEKPVSSTLGLSLPSEAKPILEDLAEASKGSHSQSTKRNQFLYNRKKVTTCQLCGKTGQSRWVHRVQHISYHHMDRVILSCALCDWTARAWQWSGGRAAQNHLSARHKVTRSQTGLVRSQMEELRPVMEALAELCFPSQASFDASGSTLPVGSAQDFEQETSTSTQDDSLRSSLCPPDPDQEDRLTEEEGKERKDATVAEPAEPDPLSPKPVRMLGVLEADKSLLRRSAMEDSVAGPLRGSQPIPDAKPLLRPRFKRQPPPPKLLPASAAETSAAPRPLSPEAEKAAFKMPRALRKRSARLEASEAERRLVEATEPPSLPSFMTTGSPPKTARPPPPQASPPPAAPLTPPPLLSPASLTSAPSVEQKASQGIAEASAAQLAPKTEPEESFSPPPSSPSPESGPSSEEEPGSSKRETTEEAVTGRTSCGLCWAEVGWGVEEAHLRAAHVAEGAEASRALLWRLDDRCFGPRGLYSQSTLSFTSTA